MLALSDEEAEHDDGERLWSIKAAAEEPPLNVAPSSSIRSSPSISPGISPGLSPQNSQGSKLTVNSVESEESGSEGPVLSKQVIQGASEGASSVTDASVTIYSTSTSPPVDPALLRQDSTESFGSYSSVKSERGMPGVLTLTPDVWELLQQEATLCWTKAVDPTCVDPVKVFRQLGESFRCAPLGPRSDVDVGVAQLMKDIKREIVVVDGMRFIVATQFDALYKKLADVLTKVDPDLANTRALDHRVQRILRACSRTVSGYDSYHIMVALMQNCTPRCLVTPGMMENCPIIIESAPESLTITSVNIFKLVTEITDGSVVTVLAVRLDLTELISFQDWASTRWLKLEPLDKVQDSLSLLSKFRDNFKALVEDDQTYTDVEDLKHMLAETVAKLDSAIVLSTNAVRRLAKEEYTRGASEARQSGSKGVGRPVAAQSKENASTSERPAVEPKGLSAFFRRLN